MNPKEKAKELVNKFIALQFGDFPEMQSINCALICVEEMMIALEHAHDNTWAENGCFTGTKSYDYWNQVQTELKAMRDE